MTRWRAAVWSIAVTAHLCAVGCDASLPASEPDVVDVERAGSEPVTAPPAPPEGATTPPLSIMTWNVEWLQDPGEGPSDDALQLERVLEVLRRSESTLIALQEVSTPAAFERLVADLPHHAGVLAEYRWTQKLALLYDERRLRLLRLAAIDDLDDAGRPPLDARFELTPEGTELRVVVVHAKASSDPASHAIRVRFASGLARRLTPLDERTLVLGDFNDRLDRALAADEPSPYRPLLDAGLHALTGALSAGVSDERSSWLGPIDHILASSALADGLVAGSADVLQRELFAVYPDFSRTVSDHFPVVASVVP